MARRRPGRQRPAAGRPARHRKGLGGRAAGPGRLEPPRAGVSGRGDRHERPSGTRKDAAPGACAAGGGAGRGLLAAVTLAGYAARAAPGASVGARTDANSREVAAEASEIRGNDVSVAAQLSLAAYRISPTVPALSSLLEVIGRAGGRAAARFGRHRPGRRAEPRPPGPRGRRRRWNAAPVGRGTARAAIPFRPAHRTAAERALRRRVRAGRTAARRRGRGRQDPAVEHRRPAQAAAGWAAAGRAGTVYSLAFSPDGRVLAAGSADDTRAVMGHWPSLVAREPLATLTGPAAFGGIGRVQPGRRDTRRGERRRQRPAVAPGRIGNGAPGSQPGPAGPAAHRGRARRGHDHVQPGRPYPGRRRPGRRRMAVERRRSGAAGAVRAHR